MLVFQVLMLIYGKLCVSDRPLFWNGDAVWLPSTDLPSLLHQVTRCIRRVPSSRNSVTVSRETLLYPNAMTMAIASHHDVGPSRRLPTRAPPPTDIRETLSREVSSS